MTCKQTVCPALTWPPRLWDLARLELKRPLHTLSRAVSISFGRSTGRDRTLPLPHHLQPHLKTVSRELVGSVFRIFPNFHVF